MKKEKCRISAEELVSNIIKCGRDMAFGINVSGFMGCGAPVCIVKVPYFENDVLFILADSLAEGTLKDKYFTLIFDPDYFTMAPDSVEYYPSQIEFDFNSKTLTWKEKK